MFVYENGILKVMFYKSLLVVTDHEILIATKKQIIAVRGINLYISFFEKNEIHICGNIGGVDLRAC